MLEQSTTYLYLHLMYACCYIAVGLQIISESCGDNVINLLISQQIYGQCLKDNETEDTPTSTLIGEMLKL